MANLLINELRKSEFLFGISLHIYYRNNFCLRVCFVNKRGELNEIQKGIFHHNFTLTYNYITLCQNKVTCSLRKVTSRYSKESADLKLLIIRN